MLDMYFFGCKTLAHICIAEAGNVTYNYVYWIIN